MLVRLDAWTDFTCPFCFLATLTLDRLHHDAQCELHWRAYQLHRGGGPLPAETRTAIEKEHVRLAEIVRSQHGLTLRPGPIGINTRAAHTATRVTSTRVSRSF